MRNTKISAVLASLALIILTGCTSVPTTNEIPASIANAKTAADHQRIADYFAQEAVKYDAEAAWHEKMGATYAGRPKGDLESMMSHCRTLHEDFVNAAKEARSLEQEHREMAKTLGN